MEAARGKSVSEERSWGNVEKTGEIYQQYVDGLSQPTPSTCTLDAIRSLSTPPSTRKTMNTTCAQTPESRGHRHIHLNPKLPSQSHSDLVGQTALRLRPSRVSCKTRLPNKGKHMVVQAYSFALIAASLPVKLNLERKEDDNVDTAESGKKFTSVK